MIEKIVDEIVKRKEGRCTTDEIAVYKYGYTVMVEIALIILASICIGYITHTLIELLLFSLSLISLRTFGGGYHAQTARKCISLSTLLTVGFCLTIDRLSGAYLPLLIVVILGYVVTIRNYIPKSAVGDENINARCKKIITWIFPAFVMISLLMFGLGQPPYAISIIVGELVWIVLIILLQITEKKSI